METREKMQEILHRLDGKLARLSEKADKAGREKKEKYLNAMEPLLEKREACQRHLAEIVSRDEGSWKRLKGELEEAYEEFKTKADEILTHQRRA